MKIITGKVENSFTNEQLTHHSGLWTVWNYVRSNGLTGLINGLFPTAQYNSVKFNLEI